MAHPHPVYRLWRSRGTYDIFGLVAPLSSCKRSLRSARLYLWTASIRSGLLPGKFSIFDKLFLLLFRVYRHLDWNHLWRSGSTAPSRAFTFQLESAGGG